MKRMMVSTLGLLALCALATACGDDSSSDNGGSGASVNLPVEEDAALSELTPQEAQDVCAEIVEASVDFAASVSDVTCQISGITAASVALLATGGEASDADLASTCQTATDQCLAEATEEVNVDEECADAENQIGSDCTATAGELEACYNDTFDSGSQAIAAYADMVPPCTDVTAAWLTEMIENPPEGVEQPEDPASCVSLTDQCPELADAMN